MRALRYGLIALLAAAPLAAQNYSGAFIVRLGRDTTAVERFSRTAARIEGDGVLRAPRTALRHFVFDFTEGRITRAEVVTTRPGAPAAAAPIQRSVATFARDSVVVETRRDTTVQTRRVAVPAGAVPAIAGAASSWIGIELAIDRFRRQRADSIGVPVYLIGSPQLSNWSVWKIGDGRDSVAVYDGNDVFHVKIDRNGRVQGDVPLSGTQQFTVERAATVDVTALATAFAARDQQGQSLGTLSTRDTLRASVAGAAIWIDYGRPAKRGRVLFGSTIVPWGSVWRTGANAATQLRTDRDLEIQGVVIPAGTYTLWTIPNRQGGWKLLFNRQTGQWGTEHDPARDMAQLDLRTTTLPAVVERFTIGVAPEGGGGVLNLDWDTVRASLTFSVR